MASVLLWNANIQSLQFHDEGHCEIVRPKAEAAIWLKVQLLSPCLTLPRGSPHGSPESRASSHLRRNKDRRLSWQVLVIYLYSPAKRNTKYIPQEEIIMSSDNYWQLFTQLYPQSFLFFSETNSLWKLYTFTFLQDTYANMMVFSLSLIICHHLPSSPQGLVQLVRICLVAIV